MGAPKLTEAQRRALWLALDHDWGNEGSIPQVVARMVAEAEQAARAKAWDEGYNEGRATPNPYRSTS